MHIHRPFKMGSDVQETGGSYPERTPATPIRQGRNTPGGMIAVFVLIGSLVLAVTLLT